MNENFPHELCVRFDMLGECELFPLCRILPSVHLELVIQRCQRWNESGKPGGRLTAGIFSNAAVVEMGLSPAAAGAPSPGRPAARGAPLFPPGKRGRRGPERENLVGFPPLDFSFPSWGVFCRRIHLSVVERKSGRNSGRSDDIRDVIGYELRAVGRVDFGRVTGYVTRGM